MRESILQFINKELLSGRADVEVSEEDDLLGSGLVYSMGVMRLVAFLESAHQIKIPFEDLVIENFISVNAISNYVKGRISGG